MDDLDADTGESLLQLEIRKCQQAFAMSTHDEPEEFEDIQFFHRIPPVALTSFKIGANSGEFMRGGFMAPTSGGQESYTDADVKEGYQDSESSYMFPENVMEYGEPQFFPGNCVGYLETILEETDEDCEEEEGSSGRHWWTPDSDTDTESVIRLDPTATSKRTENTASTNPFHQKLVEINDNVLLAETFLAKANPTQALPSIGPALNETTSTPSSPPFRSTASTKPFEIENLYLFDQLDLAFEETLLKPRRRTGFAFEAELHLPPLEIEPPEEPTVVQETDAEVAQNPMFQTNACSLETEPSKNDSLPSAKMSQNFVPENDDEEPAVVNEEDFFCSSPSSSDDNSDLSETESSEDSSSSSTSGSEEDKKSGKVLAEFSMHNFCSGPSDYGEMYKNNHANPHRRSFEAPSKIRSFRSYDSLNSLAGTELLFSNPETFPAITEGGIQPYGQEGFDSNGGQCSSGGESRSSSTEDRVVASRKNSGEASSENLSEDSGIHELLPSQQSPETESSPPLSAIFPPIPEFPESYPSKPEFALNPFIYSSASEDNSMSYNYSTLSEASSIKRDQSDLVVNYGRSSTLQSSSIITSTSLTFSTSQTGRECGNYHQPPINSFAPEDEPISINMSPGISPEATNVNNREGLEVMISSNRSGPMSTLGSCSSGTSASLKRHPNPSSEVEEDVPAQMASRSDHYYEAEYNSLLLLLPLPLAPGLRVPVLKQAGGLEEEGDSLIIDSHKTRDDYQSARAWPSQEFSQAYQQHPSSIAPREKETTTHPIGQNLRDDSNPSWKVHTTQYEGLLTQCQQEPRVQPNFGPVVEQRVIEPVAVHEYRRSENAAAEPSVQPNFRPVVVHKYRSSENAAPEPSVQPNFEPVVEDRGIEQNVFHDYQRSEDAAAEPSFRPNFGTVVEHRVIEPAVFHDYRRSEDAAAEPIRPNFGTVVEHRVIEPVVVHEYRRSENAAAEPSGQLNYYRPVVEHRVFEPAVVHEYRRSGDAGAEPRFEPNFGPVVEHRVIEPVVEQQVIEPVVVHEYRRSEEDAADAEADYVTLVSRQRRSSSESVPSVSLSFLTGVDHLEESANNRERDVETENCQSLEQHQSHQSQLPQSQDQESEIMQVEPRAASPAAGKTIHHQIPSLGIPIPIKTYGGASNNDVAVYLVSSGSSRTPSPTVPAPPLPQDAECGSATGSLRTKTVHFSPVVSEISWRESYAEAYPEDNDPESPGHSPEGNDPVPDSQEQETAHEQGPIEKVHVHSQVLSEPLPKVIPRTEKERLLALEPTEEHEPVRMPMSSVPDIVSQCEISTVHGQKPIIAHDEVDASPHLPSNGDQGRPYYYQQQIFPAMFVATAKEAAEVNHVHFKKNGKKATYVAPPLAPPSPSSTNQTIAKSTNKSNGKRATEKDGVAEKEGKSKPGFFQRLSKIRLSGNKAKQPKTKIYPKEIEPLNAKSKGSVPLGPILKKGPPSPLVLEDHLTPPEQSFNRSQSAPPKEHDECSEAFENILEEIAGLNTILQRQQFPQSSQPGSATSNGSGKRLFAERKQFLNTSEPGQEKGSTLDSKLSQFREDTSRTRDQISRSHPDLETIEGLTTARRLELSPDGLDEAGSRQMTGQSSPVGRDVPASAESKNNEREWYRLLRSAAEKYYHGGRRPEDGSGMATGIVETDLDTGTSRELLDAELVILDELGLSLNPPPLPSTLPPSNNGAKAQSLTNLTSGLKLSIAPNDASNGIDADAEERARSLEFLLDEEQKSAASPPENKLREDNRQLSEHELRIQRSLQKINVPDWYRRHSYRSKSADRDRSAELRKDTPLVTSNGTTALQLLKRNDYGSSGGLAGGWAGLSAYRTPSLSSIHNGGLTTGSLNRSNFIRGNKLSATMSAARTSKESLLSPSSTASQSPSAFERSSFTYGMPLTMTRFGKGRLSSTSGTSPAGSTPSTPGQSATLSAYVKQPYLGWRSQEKLNIGSGTTSPSGGLKLSTYRPPAERLAADINLRQKKVTARPTGSDRPPLPKWPSSRSSSEKSKTMSLPPPASVPDEEPFKSELRNASPSIHDSIKEVSDAISEFVTNGNETAPKPVPRQKNAVKKQALWFESSFVGKKSQAQ